MGTAEERDIEVRVTTTEGMEALMFVRYAAGDAPERIDGCYAARDGGGQFLIEREGDGFVERFTGQRASVPELLVPAVVEAGAWQVVTGLSPPATTRGPKPVSSSDDDIPF